MVTANKDNGNGEAAALLAENGLSVFPLWEVDAEGNCTCGDKDCDDQGKHPNGILAPQGCLNATTTYDTVKQWWKKRPSANIGIATGTPSGLFVVDVDVPDDAPGANILATVDPERAGADGFEEIPTARTRRGGRHFYFKQPLEGMRNATKVAGLPIDIRGTGGYAVAPPSIGAGGRWEWLRDIAKYDLTEAPQWVLDFIHGKAPAGSDGGSLSRLEFLGTLDDHPGVEKGRRNNVLCKLVGQYLLDHGIDNDLLPQALAWGARCSPPIPPAEVRKTVVALVEKECKKTTTKAKATPRLIFQGFDTIEPKELEWYWPGVFPSAAVSLLVGSPGEGKTALAIALCALTSTGGTFPDGEDCQQGSAIYSSTEDDEARVLLPRLIANNADLRRVYCVPGVATEGSDLVEPLQFAEHLAELENRCREIGDVRLAIFDPVVMGLGSADSHKNDQVRRAIGPLTTFAQRLNLCCIGITHPSKGEGSSMLNRVSGSIAFGAVARSVWCVTRDPDDGDRRLFWCTKSNYGSTAGRDFTIGDGACLEWGQTVLPFGYGNNLDDREDTDDTAFDEAKRWLASVLQAGDMPAATILKMAKSDGIGERTLKKAKASLGVGSKRVGEGWVWVKPPTLKIGGSEIGSYEF